jgi:hypothetical protein
MKITKDKLKEAQDIAKKYGYKQMFVNNKGELFTSENLASVSVDHDKDKYTEVPLNVATVSTTEKAKVKSDSLTLEIDACTSVEDVEEILNAEKEGENRADVIAACELKIEQLK